MTLDFAALPPEINSARMYAGPGSGPMMAAAASWDALAGELESFAAGYSSVLAHLQGRHWSGSASDAMAAAAAPYVRWTSTTAVQAGQAAGQARAAAAAYEAAFAATVPPAVVAANRAQLAMLVVTNFFGQNTPAIAATEAAYAVMWAQDAAAMYGYVVSAAPAAALTPFKAAPKTTNTGGQFAHAAGVAHTVAQAAATAPHQAHGLSVAPSTAQSTSPAGSPPAIHPLTGINDFVKTYLAPWNSFASFNYNTHLTIADDLEVGSITALAARRLTLPETPPLLLGEYALGGGGPLSLGERAFGSGFYQDTGEFAAPKDVLVSTGQAASAGQLSVPQGWSRAVLSTGHAARLPETGQGSGTASAAKLQSALEQPAGPMGAPAPRGGRTPVLRMRDRRFRMPRPSVGG